MLQQRRPDCAADIVAAGHNGDGNTAVTGEPLRCIRHQWPESRGGADPDQEVRERKQDEIGGKSGGDVAGAERAHAAQDGSQGAESVGEFPHHHTAQRKADHRKGERQRSVAAGDAERRLNWGQHDWHRPRADASDAGEHHGGSQPQPGVRRFDPGVNRSEYWHVVGVVPAASFDRRPLAPSLPSRSSPSNSDLTQSWPLSCIAAARPDQ